MQNHPTRSSRRGFLKGALASPLAAQVVAQTQSSANGIPTRPLGRTGVQVSILGIGGSHASRLREEADASRFFHTAVDNGITFMDNAWEYAGGRAEEIMGRALAEDGLRKKCFLMTKVCERDYSGAMTQLEDSLKKLRTDYLDLWQFHECNYHNDPEYLMEKGGLRAAMEAKRQGKVRFVGFTGHKHPDIHNKLLRLDFAWDACQMPNNVMDSGFESFRQQTMPFCLERGIGIIGMKGCGGDGRMVRDGHVTLEQAYRYFLSQPVSVQVVGLSNLEELNTAIRFGREFKPLTDAEMREITQRIRPVMSDGRYELFKSSKRYDSGFHRKQHGFDTQGV